MLTHNLGYPRIGSHRELKQALEQYWSGTLSLETLLQAGKTLRRDQ
jgi:5-methyltetrahydropteroyltriglutamate--homocysteine methyltransferase